MLPTRRTPNSAGCAPRNQLIRGLRPRTPYIVTRSPLRRLAPFLWRGSPAARALAWSRRACGTAWLPALAGRIRRDSWLPALAGRSCAEFLSPDVLHSQSLVVAEFALFTCSGLHGEACAVVTL